MLQIGLVLHKNDIIARECERKRILCRKIGGKGTVGLIYSERLMPSKEDHKIQKSKAKKLVENRKKLLEQAASGMRKSVKGPPLKEVDPQLVEDYASTDYTAEEIAAWIGCNVDILYQRQDLNEAMKRGRAKGNSSLRRKLHQMAFDDGIPSVAIFLGKARCGYNDGGNSGTAEQKPFTKTEI